MSARASTIAALAGALAFGCSGQTSTTQSPPRQPAAAAGASRSVASAPKEPREPPPPSGPARPYTSPKTTWTKLGNGLEVATRIDRAVPIVHLRIAALAGSAMDGERTGLAAVCARAIAESGAGAMDDRELRGKLEALGATLQVDVDASRAVYGLSVAKDRLGEAVELLAQITTRPRLGAADVERVRKEAAARAASLSREDADWAAMMVLYDDLFALPSEHHPYASYDARADEIAKIKPADCKDYHRRLFVPKNMLVAATGDVKPEEVAAAAKKSLGARRGGEVPSLSLTDPMPPASLKLTLVDRPGSTQSVVVVGTLGPQREEATHAPFRVAEQLLGGAFTGRLHRDLREARGLSYITHASVDELAGAPSVFYAYGATETKSTGAVLDGLLGHLRKLAEAVPEQEEIDTAANFLVGIRSVRMGRPGASASDIVQLWANRLPDDAPDTLAKAMRDATPEAVTRAFSEHVRVGHAIVVVVGDAARTGPLLQPFGEVKVVDPTRGFTRVRTLPQKSGQEG
ncbi:M16 family metallopeptidase [Polyangium aurulentum]|uniref:M16 family metallopeptidase n=1 Tax=Polyangium aurulentum TaxID=2567896 RepID=UPI0010ADA743|nr:pitrilysin family protein [Polyangium aurulentum]UQA58333.1 insulinase family protein [Polyangium aurulentum]